MAELRCRITNCVYNKDEYCCKGDIMVGGANFGCGSSREHAPLVIKTCKTGCVIAKSFARIHVANLVNAGIIPFTFKNSDDYDRIDQNDVLCLPDVRAEISDNKEVKLINKTKNEEYTLCYELSNRQRDMILAGGLLNYTKSRA